MRVTYFYRSLNCGFSIKKVLNTISDEVSKTREVKSYYIPAHRADVISVVKNIFYVFRHRDRKGINHVTGDVHYCIVGLIGCKSVLTIHDLSHVHFAKNPIKKAFMMWVWYKIPVLFATKVVCISEHTRNELMKITKRKDIDVIYNAIDPSFFNFLKPFNTHQPIILQIGTAWNKNISNLVNALETIKCHLVIVGFVEKELSLLLKEKNISYSEKINLTDSELIEEYKQCDIVSFCSLYEGFGMPIIEANAIGRCVITSSIAPMTEIANNAACLVNPNDINSITNGFKKIILDNDFRSTLVSNGFSNIKRFNVANVSKSYLQLYSKLEVLH